MSEFRAALQEVIMAGEACTQDDDIHNAVRYNRALTDAKALLPRPERINRPETGDGFTQRMQAERLENASNRRYPAPPKDPQPGEYEPGDGAPPQSEPEPRITREEAENLLRAYGYAVRLEQPLTEKFEACLAAMLRSEPTEITAEKPAIPRMKPRTVPLDEDEIAREWQPIATAPHDGTQILAWISHQGWLYERAVGVKWCGEFSGWSMPGISGLQPTHWMLLPSPPAASDGEHE